MKNIKYFENLDGLRFICFLMVFFFHSFYSNNQELLNSSSYEMIKKNIFGNGNIGVNFFFVLSGFLITYLLLKEKSSNRNINIINFLFRRILRIWPLYFFCVFFGFIIFPYIKLLFGEVPQESAHLINYLTFTNNFDIIQNGLPDSSVLGVLWSIAIEEQFYFFWPFVVYFFSVEKLIYPLITLLIYNLMFISQNTSNYLILEHHSLSCMGDLVIGGIGAWLLFNSRKTTVFFENLSKWGIICVYLIFISLFFLRDELRNLTSFYVQFDRFILSILIIFIILEQTLSINSFYKMKNFIFFSKLGKYTYSMYSLHFIAILILIKLMSYTLPDNSGLRVFIIEPIGSLGLTILFSIISYNLLEKPFLKLKNKFS